MTAMIGKIAQMDNLREAFLKASRGKRGKREVVRFWANLHRNLQKIRDALLGGHPPIGDYRYFKVYDPKERTICAAAFPERVLHHAIMNICEPALERASIFDSYACRTGKGQFVCLDRAQHFCRGYGHYLKMDVRKYFDNIPHGILLGMLDAKFQDTGLSKLFRNLVGSYCTSPGRGLPIGNLCSQHFANFYLGKLDRYAKETLRCQAYLRYVDDFILWHHDQQWLREAGDRLLEYAGGELGLELKPPVHGKCEDGLNMLGFRVFPFSKKMSGRSKRRYLRKRRELDEGVHAGAIPESVAAARFASLEAFASHARISGLRQSYAQSSSSRRPLARTA